MVRLPFRPPRPGLPATRAAGRPGSPGDGSPAAEARDATTVAPVGAIPDGPAAVPAGVDLFPHADRAADAALVAGLALDDEQAAVAFVHRFQRPVYGLALSVTRDPALAEDVAQEVFVRVWRAAAGYDVRRASVLTWVLTITRNAAIDAVRLRRAAPTDDDALEQILLATTSPPETERTALRNLERDRAVAHLRDLPAEQARAVVLAVIGGCTAAEVAEHEHIPLGTAKTRIRTGLRRLRERMTAHEPAGPWRAGGEDPS